MLSSGRKFLLLCFAVFQFPNCCQVCQDQTKPNLNFTVVDKELTLYLSNCTYTEAKKACKKNGGTLVNLFNTFMMKEVEYHVPFFTQNCFWTNGFRAVNKTWIWRHKSLNISDNAAHWKPGYPNLNLSHEAAICQRFNGTSMEWIDLKTTDSAYYMCEKEKTLWRRQRKFLVLYQEQLDYISACKACGKKGATLVNVKTKAIQLLLEGWVNHLLKPSRQQITFWSGGYKTQNDTWMWSDRSPINMPDGNTTNFHLWKTDYPNKSGTLTALALGFTLNQTNLTKGHQANLIWFNQKQEELHSFICQQESPKVSCGKGRRGNCNLCPSKTPDQFTISKKKLDDCGSNCSSYAKCQKINGKQKCSCISGYIGDGFTCEGFCEKMRYKNFTFPQTKQHQTAYSYQLCPQSKTNLTKGSSMASIRCENRTVNSQTMIGFNKTSFKRLSCNEKLNTSLKTTSSHLQHILNDSKYINSSYELTTAECTELLNHMSLYVDSIIKAQSEIPPDLFKVLVSLLSVIQNVLSKNSAFLLDYEMKEKSIELLSASTFLVEIKNNLPLEINTASFVIEISTFPKDNESEPCLEFSPSYLHNDTMTIQPVVIILPEETFKSTETSEEQLSYLQSKTRSVFILYKEPDIFPAKDNVSTIVSAETRHGGLNKTLKDHCKIRFRNTGAQYGRHQLANDTQHALKTTLSCVFWNFNTHSWSRDGCFLNLTTNPPECLCNHLTSFALIITSEYVISDVSLDVVSTVGSILSILGLFCTILVHAGIREIRKSRSSKIVLNISCNLLMAYVLFLAGVSQTQNKIICDCIAIALHYFLLTSWCWMTAYSYEIYVSLVKVFRKSTKQYLQRVSLFAYGFPALVVSLTSGITLGYVDKKQQNYLYGSAVDPLLESSYRSSSACWLHGFSLYIVFLLPVGMMLIFNLFAFSSILREISGKKKEHNPFSKKRSRDNAWVAITLAPLMGITWFLGYFILITRVPIYVTITSWLFASFNSLQGFLIFFMTCVRRPNLRKMWTNPVQNFMRSVIGTTTEVDSGQTTRTYTVSFRK